MTGARVVAPGEGTKLQLGGSAPVIKVGPQTGSRLIAMFESDLPPGGGFPFAHWHEEFEEVFYVLDGQIDYLAGHDWATASAGSVVFVPPGVVHAFRNASDRPARHLVAVAPAQALGLIEDLATAGPHQFEAVHERHRSHFARDSRRPCQAGGLTSSPLPGPTTSATSQCRSTTTPEAERLGEAMHRRAVPCQAFDWPVEAVTDRAPDHDAFEGPVA